MRIIFVIAFFVAFSGRRVDADILDQPYAEAWFVNTQRTISESASVGAGDGTSVAIAAGGSAGVYPGPAAGANPPQATVVLGQSAITVQLAQSAFGQMVAGPIGFPGAEEALMAEGSSLFTNSAPYGRFTTITGQILPTAEGSWDIHFPGVINPDSGRLYTNSTWFENLNRRAALRFNAVLRINPFHSAAAQGLLETLYQRVAAKTAAGNNAFMYSAFLRLTAQNPAIAENAILQTNAIVFYQRAAQEALTALKTQPEGALLDGTYPYIPSAAITNQSQKTLDSYVRAVASQGLTLEKLIRLKYMTTYSEPTTGGGAYNPIALLTFIDSHIADMQRKLVAINALQSLPVIQSSELGQAQQHLQQLVRLRATIANGRVPFVGAHVSQIDALEPDSYVYAEYTPDFVPFQWDPSYFSDYANSFQVLLAQAQTLAANSAALDTQAQNRILQHGISEFQLQQNLQNIENRYYSELGVLCGYIRLDDGSLIPDVLYGLLPPEERQKVHRYNFNAGESLGGLYEQWKRIDSAQTQLDLAVLQLTNTYSAILSRQETANQIAGGLTNLALLVLQNGKKIAALDELAGNLRAEAIIASEEAEKTKSSKSDLTTAVNGVNAAIGGYQQGGYVGAFMAAATSVANDLSAPSDASLSAQNIEANLQRRLGQIEAQKARIVAAEHAAVIYQQANALLLQTADAVHGLYLQAEQQKLNILIARESLDMQRLQLANMVSRTHFLLQQFIQAITLETQNPLAKPDYRLLQNLEARDAEESFFNAQEAAYLAAKAAQYRVNHGPQAATVNALLRSVLAARRGSGLVQALLNLQYNVQSLFLQQGAQISPQLKNLSLRHFVVQKNVVTLTNEFGEWNQNTATLERFNDSSDVKGASDGHWLQFLRSRTATNSITGERLLQFVFSTSINLAQPPLNPLFDRNLADALIMYAPSLGAYGLGVNFSGRGINNFISYGDQVITAISQEGASYIRSNPWLCDSLDASALRVWNLDPILGEVTASINGAPIRGSPQYHERSPANDRWVFSMSSFDSPANDALLSNMEQITDIQIQFWISGFTPSCR